MIGAADLRPRMPPHIVFKILASVSIYTDGTRVLLLEYPWYFTWPLQDLPPALLGAGVAFPHSLDLRAFRRRPEPPAPWTGKANAWRSA